MIKPPGFDPSRNTPARLCVWRTARADVLDSWGAAQLITPHGRRLGLPGCVIDNRGTPAPKGAAAAGHIRQLGPLSTRAAAALKELARTCPYVDASRVAIWAERGGRHAQRVVPPSRMFYQVASPSRQAQPISTTLVSEIYMQTPETNLDGYRPGAHHFAKPQGETADITARQGGGPDNTHFKLRGWWTPHELGNVRLHGLSNATTSPRSRHVVTCAADGALPPRTPAPGPR